MISFLSILLWNSEHPRYLDILLFRQDLPRHARDPDSGIFVSLRPRLWRDFRFAPTRRFTWIVRMFFLFFHLDKDRVGNWLRVTAPAWIAISLVPSLMASSSADQLLFLFPLRLLKELVPLPDCLVWQNIKVVYLWISGRQFSDILQLKKRAILVSCTQLTRKIFYPPGGHQVIYRCLPQSTFWSWASLYPSASFWSWQGRLNQSPAPFLFLAVQSLVDASIIHGKSPPLALLQWHLSSSPLYPSFDSESGTHVLLTRLLQKGQGKIPSQHQVLPRFFSALQGFLEKPW